jgi:DNA-binding NtrC family response regulator
VARVLVVDDEPNVRKSLALALRHEGYEVETAGSAEEAEAVLREESFALVLTDLRLPGQGGLELLQQIKHDAPGTDVVVMTAFGTIDGAVEAMRLGAKHYLSKPFETRALLETVEAAMRANGASRAAGGGPANDGGSRYAEIIGRSRAIRDLLDLVARVADTESTALITGETGTGKELVGRAIHEKSRRRDRIFSAVNSAAFPETLLESELFGHRRGAFTGASAHKKGLFEAADQGTVFLDEVAEMPLSMQAKLLRFLQTGEIRPVGSEQTRHVDVRLVTATNKDLEAEVAAGRFREDLYYRLAVIPIHIPPLRERREDIELLASHFLARFAARSGKTIRGIEPAAQALLSAYAWPGNVRELENCIERGVALCSADRIRPEDLPQRLRSREEQKLPGAIASLESVEREHILATLERVGWNRKRAASALRISTTTLWRRLKDFGIDANAAPRDARSRFIVS